MSRLSNSSFSMLREPAAYSNETQDQSVKDIFKCGFCSVKLIKDSEFASTAYQRFWTVFYVLNERAPILELFKKEQPLQNFNNQDSVAKFNLKNCNYVSIPILSSANDKENSNEFMISLDNQLLQICVESNDSNDKELLNEWVNCMREKLASLNVFSSKDNPYSKEPVNVIKKMSSSRSPASRPLPPIPTEQQQNSASAASISLSSQVNGYTSRQTNGQARLTPQMSRTMERMVERLNGRSSLMEENRFVTSIRVNFPSTSSSSSSSQNNYEPLASANSIDQENATRRLSSNCPTGSNGAQVLSLRESQIVTLRKEINNPGGVKLRIRKIDCVDSLALVEWLGRIFIAGWKQKVNHHFA